MKKGHTTDTTPRNTDLIVVDNTEPVESTCARILRKEFVAKSEECSKKQLREEGTIDIFREQKLSVQEEDLKEEILSLEQESKSRTTHGASPLPGLAAWSSKNTLVRTDLFSGRFALSDKAYVPFHKHPRCLNDDLMELALQQVSNINIGQKGERCCLSMCDPFTSYVRS